MFVRVSSESVEDSEVVWVLLLELFQFVLKENIILGLVGVEHDDV